MKLFILLVSFLLLIALDICNNESLTFAAAPVIDVNGSQGVILPLELAPEVLKQCSRLAPSAKEGFWKPSESQIKRLEGLLPEYVVKNPPSIALDLAKRLSEYNRQYIGVLSNGKKIIYVNFFIKKLYQEKPPSWQERAVIVCDGGKEYWGIEFDIDAETFTNLITNGEA